MLAGVLCLPAMLFAGPGGAPDRPMVVVAALVVVGAVIAWLAGDRASSARREVLGVAVIAATAAALIGLAARSELPGVTWLGMVAAASVSMATIRRTTIRLGLQAAIVAAAGALLAAGRPDLTTSSGLVLTLGPLVLLVAITALASALAGDLELARRRELETRRAAERRSDLLGAVRQLSGAAPGEVADVTVGALRSLGFRAAAVLLVDRGRLVAHRVAGVEVLADYGPGLSGQALRTDRTAISPDYKADALRLPGFDLGAVVATPIRADGRILGVLAVGYADAGEPPMGDVEVVEVLAAHLGEALATDRVVASQANLLARLRDLDRLRASLVDRVSEDLRDPLAVVRTTSQTLAEQASQLPDEQRRALLRRLTIQATDLSGALEALLDFSRVQAGRSDPQPAPVDLVDLLTPPLTGTGVALEVTGRPEVVVDRDLVQRALELLRRGMPDLTRGLVATPRGTVITVDIRLQELDALQGGFARSLAEQLLVAGGARSERLPDGLRLILPLHLDVEVAP